MDENKTMVTIPIERYEDLIKAEETLKILCRVILEKDPYNADTFRAVAEPYFPNKEKNEV